MRVALGTARQAAGVLFVCLSAASPVSTGEPPQFSGSLETASAVVRFHVDDGPFAAQVGEAVDEAAFRLGESFGRIEGKITAYVYATDAEMADGLVRVLGYQPWEVEAVLRVGISACSQRTLHLHRRLAKWGDALLHVIVDEYSQGVIEERYGPSAALSATWIEEGLSSLLAYEALRHRLPQFEAWFMARSYKTAFRSLLAGRMPRFTDIDTRERWYRGITRDRDTWSTQYAAALMGVLYIVEQHGRDAINEVLSRHQAGVPYSVAIAEVLGYALSELDGRVRRWLLWQGLVDHYRRYTLAGGALAAACILLLVAWRRRRFVASGTPVNE